MFCRILPKIVSATTARPIAKRIFRIFMGAADTSSVVWAGRNSIRNWRRSRCPPHERHAPRTTPDTPTAEFALSVADDWQRLGLARALLDRLRASAAEAGVQRLYGSVLDENHGMLALMASQGARPRRDPRGGWGLVWTLDTETPADAGPPAAAAATAPATLHVTLASAA